MKKNQILTIVIIICGIVLAAAVVLAVTGVIGYHYDNAEKYKAGPTEITEPIRNLDIHWINGAVHIAYHKENTVTLSETSKNQIADDMMLRWWLDGDTLRVQYAKEKVGFWINWNQEKELILTLPEEMTLVNVAIEASSGDLYIPELQVETATLRTTSGNIAANLSAPVSNITSDNSIAMYPYNEIAGVDFHVPYVTAHSTSGSIKMTVSGQEAWDIYAESTSGSIQIEAANVDYLIAETTSGIINATADCISSFSACSTSGNIGANIADITSANIKTTSGTVEMTAHSFVSLRVSSTSGDVHANLPTEPGWEAEITTTSGTFNHDMYLRTNGDNYVCGIGSGTIGISTTSGNIHLSPIE